MIRVFNLYIPKSFFLLGLAEFLLFLGAVYLAYLTRFGVTPESQGVLGPLLGKSTVFALVLMLSMGAFGLYQKGIRATAYGILARLIAAFVVAFALLGIVFYVFPSLFLGRGIFSIAMGYAFLGTLVARMLFYRLIELDQLKRRVLVIGTGEKARKLTELRRKSDQRGWRIVGFVRLKGEHAPKVDEQRVIRPEGPLIDLVRELDVDELVVATDERRKALPVEEILDCKMSGIDVVDLPTFFERHQGKIVLEVTNPSWLIFSEGFRHSRTKDAAKRAFDVLVSAALLLLTLPVMGVVAVLIHAHDRGPVFYRQVRVGKNWRLFQVVKFRSMVVDAERDGAQFAKQNDDRITPIGKFIRKTRIDELPQLFNVLKGEMSFVGPRPERPEFVEEFSKTIPFYAERHRVKPGITGWAQISYPYGASEKDTVEKLQYDLYYVKNYNLLLDVSILLQTVEVVLWGKGAR